MRNFIIMLLICSFTMSALGVAYMVVTPFLAKRYSAKGLYYAWLIMIIGLIIPLRPRFDNPFVKVIPTDTVLPIIQVGNGAPFIPPTANPSPPAAPTSILWTWWQTATAVWLVGAVAFLVYHMVKHYRFVKITERWSERVTDEKTAALFYSVKTEMGISKEIGLYQCASVGTPLLLGFIHPRILLPDIAFANEDLRFILTHELVHYQRKDLWYKSLVLLATAIHWFNPLMYLIARAINIQCEISCDSAVVNRTDAGTRQQYSEAIIGVVRYQSKMKTALSTNFYGGMKGMKKRIFSIMDTRNKKAGAAILCCVLMLTLGTGAAFAAYAETKVPPELISEDVAVKTDIAFHPDPDTYAAYAAFGITVSADGTKLLYQGQPVRLFVDEQAADNAFYLDAAGSMSLLAVRDAAGKLTGVEQLSAQKAQDYEDTFYANEHGAIPTAPNSPPAEPNKYDQYQPFDVTYSAENGVLYWGGQRVKLFVDEYEAGWLGAFWVDDAGTVNVEVVRDASGQITGIESITDEKAQEYRAAVDRQQNDLDGLEERVTQRVEQRMKELYPDN